MMKKRKKRRNRRQRISLIISLSDSDHINCGGKNFEEEKLDLERE
jgi:hypothetical protein